MKFYNYENSFVISSYQSVQYHTLFYWKDLSACIRIVTFMLSV